MVKTISETGSSHLFQLYSRYYTCIYSKKQKSWIFIMADGGHIWFGLYRNSWPPGRQAPRWFFMSRDPRTKWKWETPLSLFCKRVLRRGTGSYFMTAIFSPFCLESWVCITQTQVRYQKKGFFMLYNSGLTFAYEKVQSRGRKWPKRMLKAAILENGGCRHSATCRQLTPSKILIYTFIRLQQHITI